MYITWQSEIKMICFCYSNFIWRTKWYLFLANYYGENPNIFSFVPKIKCISFCKINILILNFSLCLHFYFLPLQCCRGFHADSVIATSSFKLTCVLLYVFVSLRWMDWIHSFLFKCFEFCLCKIFKQSLGDSHKLIIIMANLKFEVL